MPQQPPARARAHNHVHASATGHPAYSQTLPCEPDSAGRARRLVQAALGAWGLSGLAEAAELIVSELVANAAEHSGCRYLRVSVSRPGPGWVRVAVVDRSRTLPLARVAGRDDEDGRGLAVVDTVSDRWGADTLPWGKRVWSELRVQGSAP